MIQTGHLSRNQPADSRGVLPKSASCIGQTHRSANLARVDFVIDNEAVRGQVIEIKAPAISSAESLLLTLIEGIAADSRLSDGDEQLLSLP